MIKWYQKPIYIVTKKNFFSVLFLSFTTIFYIFENFSENDNGLSKFLFALTAGQYIGNKVASKKRKNSIFILFFLIFIISSIVEVAIGSNGIISMSLLALALGQQIGFLTAKIERKYK